MTQHSQKFSQTSCSIAVYFYQLYFSFHLKLTFHEMFNVMTSHSFYKDIKGAQYPLFYVHKQESFSEHRTKHVFEKYEK